MPVVLAATASGCRTFTGAGEGEIELAGRQVCAMTPEAGGACLAVVDGREIWRRDSRHTWSRITATSLSLQSILSVEGAIFAGAMDEAAMLRIPVSGEAERLKGFDTVPGRGEWFAGGPPLGVRALTATADASAILAAVHVGGIPRSSDGGETWTPTLPIRFDVHEVRAHPSVPGIVAAAAAVGLCISRDGGQTWSVRSKGLVVTNSLAVAILHDQVLFSVQDGPLAKRSQLWRWWIGADSVEQVRDGLPQWLDGKIDTAKIAAGGERAAIVDQGGSLWLSGEGSGSWKRIATDLTDVFALSILL
jgi:hypothetical protein